MHTFGIYTNAREIKLKKEPQQTLKRKVNEWKKGGEKSRENSNGKINACTGRQKKNKNRMQSIHSEGQAYG